MARHACHTTFEDQPTPTRVGQPQTQIGRICGASISLPRQGNEFCRMKSCRVVAVPRSVKDCRTQTDSQGQICDGDERCGKDPHAGQLQVCTVSAGTGRRSPPHPKKKEGAPRCHNWRWHRYDFRVFEGSGGCVCLVSKSDRYWRLWRYVD